MSLGFVWFSLRFDAAIEVCAVSLRLDGVTGFCVVSLSLNGVTEVRRCH